MEPRKRFSTTHRFSFCEKQVLRYVAITWNANSISMPAVCRALDSPHSTWKCSFELPDTRVYIPASSNQYLRLERNSGIVIGRLFRAPTDDEADPTSLRVLQLNHRDTTKVLSSEGRHLVSNFWGDYVAVLSTPARRVVLKDPSGNLPCFYAQTRGTTIFFSCITDVLSLLEAPIDVDWAFIRAYSVVGAAHLNTTGLKGVNEVHRGECARISDDKVDRQLYWVPAEISRAAVLEDPNLAARRLRDTARQCIHAHAACHESVQVSLSGGLDSSIVVSLLRDAPRRPDVTCITHFIPSGRADPRPWARLANYMGFRHFEFQRNPQIDLRSAQIVTPSVVPGSCFPYVERIGTEQPIAEQFNVTGHLTGDGGDALLGHHSRGYVASSYLRRNGIDFEYFRQVHRTALLTGRSVAAVILQSLRHVLRPKENAILRHRIRTSALLDESFQAEIQNEPWPWHPWLAAGDHDSMLLAFQLGQLCETPEPYDPLRPVSDAYPETTWPLYAQPFVEACIQSPLYVLTHRGDSRGLARIAFSGDVPASILERHWKDRAPGYFEEVLRFNLAYAREILLDGQLAANKVIDRDATERTLQDGPHKTSSLIGEAFDLMEIERWFIYWKHRVPAQRAAALS